MTDQHQKRARDFEKGEQTKKAPPRPTTSSEDKVAIKKVR